MRVERIELDSQVLGRSVLALQDLEMTSAFESFENQIILPLDPGYVYCKIPLENLSLIHYFESHGFRLVECQIRFQVKLGRPYDISNYGHYAYEQVTSKCDLDEVLGIAEETFVHDRWRVDPLLSPCLAGKRYRAYVNNSFRSQDERLFRLRDNERGQTLAFRTHKITGPKEVLFLLGGVHPEFKGTGLGLISEYFEFNELIERGIRNGITHISAGNYPVFNLDLNRPGFRVAKTFAVLRKIYS